jgi:branched-chain amino acid transport system substrate-binding protein
MRLTSRTALAVLLTSATLLAAPAVQAAQPITIGFDIEETGGLAVNGKQSLLAFQIWAEQTNAKGGLLGRPVKLVYYDDQSNPALVPGIITKLLDIDKVDILLGENGTNMLIPAMPIVIQHNLTFLGLFGLDVNSEFHYPNYFSIIPAGGANPREAFSQGFFKVVEAMDPKPKTIALVGADAEFSKNAVDGARAQAKQAGLKIVYDQTYPPTTLDYTSIVRAIQATHPDVVYVGSYPTDTVGMVRAVSEVGLKTRVFGGGMVGLQSTAIKMQLGPLLNGIEDYDFWQPVKGLATPEALAFLQEYQPRAAAEHIDPLGYYLPPFAYADLQVLSQAIEGTGGLDQKKLADYLRSHTFHTVAGDITFGPNGEWTQPRVLAIQFRGVAGHDMEQYRDAKTEVVLWPPALQTGTLQSPYDGATQ